MSKLEGLFGGAGTRDHVELIGYTPPRRSIPPERFLVLSREAGPMAEGLRRVLEPLGKVEVIVDRPMATSGRDLTTTFGLQPNYVYIPDDELNGYDGMMGGLADLPQLTAWSRAFGHLSRTLEENESVWFVEDDVAGDAESFTKLIELTQAKDVDLAALDILSKNEDPEWYFWPDAAGWFDHPWRAFQPLCRLSPRLIRKVLEFQKAHGHFIFFELLFASLCSKHHMGLFDWNKDSACRSCFSTFHYRPEVVTPKRGIAHPVKDALVHEVICKVPPNGFPRLSQASLQENAILIEDYLFLARLCRKHSFTRVVEFGSGDSTRAFLDAGCKVISFEQDNARFHRSVDIFKNEDGVKIIHCLEGAVPDLAAFQPEMVSVIGPREGDKMLGLQSWEMAIDICGCLLLHDLTKLGEAVTLDEMERRGLHVMRIPTRKGLALVVDPSRRPEMILTFSHSFDCYLGENTEGWFVEEYDAWSIMFYEAWEPVKVLETGASNGVSANLILDRLFPNPESQVHCIDLYGRDGGDGLRAFKMNGETGGHAGQLHFYEGGTCEVLAWMLTSDSFWESFDFIHLNGADDAADLLSDACQAWRLLKPGGTMILVGSGALRRGIDAFLSVYGERVTVIFEGKRVALMKR